MSIPNPVVKVTRHCNLSQFVSRVGKRSQQAGGLAIHTQVAQLIDNSRPPTPKSIKSLPKGRFYKKVQEEARIKGQPDPAQIKRAEAVWNIKKQLHSRVKRYEDATKTVKIFSNLCEVSIPPNAKELAIFRQIQMVGPTVTELFEEI